MDTQEKIAGDSAGIEFSTSGSFKLKVDGLDDLIARGKALGAKAFAAYEMTRSGDPEQFDAFVQSVVDLLGRLGVERVTVGGKDYAPAK